jgi:hypothetical protein
MERRDLAEGNRAYQSSVVDDMEASFAVTPPYTKHSRTRREADPWWEVDLGRPYPIHRITFFIQPSAQQMVSLHIMLLRHPVGFENPFLEDVRAKAVDSKEILIDGAKHKIGKEIVWEIAKAGANTPSCAAIRVQLKGINVLAMGKFQVRKRCLSECWCHVYACRVATRHSIVSGFIFGDELLFTVIVEELLVMCKLRHVPI